VEVAERIDLGQRSGPYGLLGLAEALDATNAS
jgi:hypothetical protein